LAIVTQLAILEDKFGITQGSCVIGCDGMEALRMATHGNRDWLSVTNKQSDMLSATVATVDTLSVTITPLHIKGHQDDHVQYNDLDRLARMNVDMDRLAKETLHHLAQSPTILHDDYDRHPLSFILPRVDKTTVHQNMKDELYNSIMAPKLLSYWIEKKRITNGNQSNICWQSQQKANRLAPSGFRRFISKWTSNMIASGHNMKKWKMRPYSNCPFCNTEDEDRNHILVCQHVEAISGWNDALSTYISNLVKLDTCPYLIAAIQIELQTERRGETPIVVNRYPLQLHSAIVAQRQIGWRSFTEGLLCKEFVTYQSNYYKDVQSMRTGKAWAHKAIRKSWQFLFHVWENRNNKLHQTDKIRELGGRRDLIASITSERNIGLHSLPPHDFSSYFSGSNEELLKQNTEFLRMWLSVIRNARFLHKDQSLLIDNFVTNETLRKWIDLCFEQKDGQLIERQQ